MCDYTEKDFQQLLTDDFCIKKRHEISVPNITTCHDFWEADLLSMTKSYLLHEFEIKTTRSDWVKEKRSIENKSDDGCKLRRAYALSKQLNEKMDLGIAPNYFWLCAPSNVVREEEIPDYAGLIEVYDFRKKTRIRVIKDAPRLHDGKASDKIMYNMMRSLNFKFWNSKRKWYNA
jgi:hypothetical protein